MRKIRVIDDEYDIREMLTDFLGLKGYDVIVARNGQEGIEIFKKNKPDAAIIDIKMPIMNGIESARKIKAMNPEFPIMIMTGMLENYSKEEIFDIGVNDLVLKPLDILEIERILQGYVHQQPLT
jgi:DNA-binding response OmpR family regulator